jgi:hypothetical protein
MRAPGLRPSSQSPSSLQTSARRVAELADTRNVNTIEGLARRLTEINDYFNRTNDRRGVFTAVYAPNVQRLVKEIRAGSVKDPATAERVVLALGKLYLVGLGRGQASPQSSSGPGYAWDNFTTLAKDPSVSDARILASSINAHWTMDLVEAIDEARAPDAFASDLQALGGFLVDEVSRQIKSPVGPNGKRVAAVFRDQPVMRGLSDVFGMTPPVKTATAVLLAEAFATSRHPQLFRQANSVKWGIREALLSLI